MKDKISKVKNLIKKYGILNTLKKLLSYIYSNYLVRFSLIENVYVAIHKKELRNEIRSILQREQFERIVVWRSSFGWNVPLYQRPQHIFSNFAKQETLVLYEVTRFTDPVKRIKKQDKNLYLVNYTNKAFSKILFEEIETQSKPRYLQFYSTDWNMTKEELKSYMSRGYKVVYEYIDDLNPSLAGTDELPQNVKDKYDLAMTDENIIVVVTADALWNDVVSKRGEKNLVFSSNGVDYEHFHNAVDSDYKYENEFLDLIEKGRPLVGYYGALAKWFDYELVKKIAQTGRYEVVLFGIKYDDSFEKTGLDKMSGVHFFGSKDYSVLQNYASKLDILTIPFLINDITRATSPVKLFEYMALNKPIVTTDMDECRKYESVLIGRTHEEFIEKLEEALQKSNDMSYCDLLDREALENTWKEKAKVILLHLQELEDLG